MSVPAGSTWTSTPEGTAAMSSLNRYRRAISKATRPTSHGNRGGVSGCSSRPTWRTNTRLAPSWKAGPSLLQSRHAGQGRIGREQGAVEGADTRSDDDVRPNATLSDRPQHAHLCGA